MSSRQCERLASSDLWWWCFRRSWKHSRISRPCDPQGPVCTAQSPGPTVELCCQCSPSGPLCLEGWNISTTITTVHNYVYLPFHFKGCESLSMVAPSCVDKTTTAAHITDLSHKNCCCFTGLLFWASPGWPGYCGRKHLKTIEGFHARTALSAPCAVLGKCG